MEIGRKLSNVLVSCDLGNAITLAILNALGNVLCSGLVVLLLFFCPATEYYFWENASFCIAFKMCWGVLHILSVIYVWHLRSVISFSAIYATLIDPDSGYYGIADWHHLSVQSKPDCNAGMHFTSSTYFADRLITLVFIGSAFKHSAFCASSVLF